MTDEIDNARKFLQMGQVFYANSPDELDEDDDHRSLQTLNMNDTWAWATGWGHYVPDHQLVELAKYFYHYGYCGVLYWFSEQNDQMRSEFEDINRFVDFVRNEERIRAEVPDYNKRAYTQREYTLGVKQ